MNKYKTPGQIIEEYIRKHSGNEYSHTKCMEKYAVQQSINFYKWMESNCYVESVANPGYYSNILSTKFFTLKQLYNKFLKSQNERKRN